MADQKQRTNGQTPNGARRRIEEKQRREALDGDKTKGPDKGREAAPADRSARGRGNVGGGRPAGKSARELGRVDSGRPAGKVSREQERKNSGSAAGKSAREQGRVSSSSSTDKSARVHGGKLVGDRDDQVRNEAGRGGQAQLEKARYGKNAPAPSSTHGSTNSAARRTDFSRSDNQTSYKSKSAAVSVSSAEDIKPGDTVALTIKRIGINGEGVGYFRRKTIFVPGALPGEVVQVKAVKVENSYIQGTLVHIEKSSPDRTAPPCPVYAECGGCQLQHFSYAGQLRAKEELVREAFERYAGIRELPLRPILGMDEPWSYRNKAQLQAGRQNGRIITGLYAAGSHKLVDISGCPIQHPGLNRVMREVSRIAEQLGIPVYDERQRRGVLRTVVARIGWRSQDVQLTLVTASAELPQREALIRRIRQALPEVVTLAQNVHPGKDSLIFGEETKVLWGREQLDEELGELRFALSPRAFFQLNPAQTVKLYDAVKEAAALTGHESVVDAYCGTGTIGLWLAPMASEVRGIEVIEDAVADARRNAQRSGLGNARFYADRAERLLPQWVREGFHPDVVVVDPPRTGCDAALLGALLAAKPQRLVYVSCNPSTLAKDCKTLLAGGYRLEWVQPVDMFPQTAHVECSVLLTLRGKQ